jgi:NADH:ubiquinone oxidoreductase subunit H
MGTFSDLAILVIIAAVKIALVLFILLTGIAYITWLERKVVAHIQARWGPYLVAHGLCSPWPTV